MKLNTIKQIIILSLLAIVSGCKRDIVDLQPATFPKNPIVFLDDFTGDLVYAAFGGSDVKAFQVDKDETYNGSAAAMRFDVPDANSPQGAYAGGAFFSKTGRDLSDYNALTFYVKASQPVNIGVAGFGNDFGASKYLTSLNNFPANTNWQKVIIPIPDASKLSGEKGLFFISAGAIDERGYTIWIDEVQFEEVSNMSDVTGLIMLGKDSTLNGAETGNSYNINTIQASANLPTGVDQVVNTTADFFTFNSSDPSIASVSESGVINILDSGKTLITAKLGGNDAKGSLTINSKGAPAKPDFAAPVPSFDPSSVISLYSNPYTNEPVDTWNTHWLYSTAENEFTQINGDDVIRYRNLNFVGIEFASNPVDASSMTNFHLNIWTPDPTAAPNNFKVMLVDFGADGVYGGGDDVSSEVTFTSPVLVTNNWITLDIPFSSFTGLTTRSHLAQLVLSGTLPSIYLDNVLFYKTSSKPTTAAPVPVRDAASVLSVFSDSYTNIPGTDFNPNWGQATIVTQEPIAGNNTLVYSGLNYQGTQFGTAQDVSSMSSLHIDYYSVTSTSLKVYLISPGPVETPYTLTVPTSGGWNSVDIPLTAFAPVDLKNVIQMKFDGNGDIYLDNIYFFKALLVPTVAAPTPTYSASGVISIFSDAYTNVAGTDLNPNWGQATIVTQTPIAGNNTLLYTNLNYQGIQFGSNQNVSGLSYLHLDYFSGNATSLQVYLISPGPVETPYTLTVPTVSGWNSVDIPLSAFAPVDLTNVFQMKFVGNGNVYLDNILFHN